MDERLAGLDRRVAAVADAWLTDPRDTGVYARLVAAVQARRAYLNPTLGETAGEGADDDRAAMSDGAAPWGRPEEDELLDEFADTARAAAPIAQTLRGDPHTVLTRLRGGDPPAEDATGRSPSDGEEAAPDVPRGSLERQSRSGQTWVDGGPWA